MAIKFVLVEIVLVETVLVGDPLYSRRNFGLLKYVVTNGLIGIEADFVIFLEKYRK